MTTTDQTDYDLELVAAPVCPHGRLRTASDMEYDVATDCRLCYLADRGLRDSPPPAQPPPGPGTELKAIYGRLDLPVAGCGGCAGLARQMDEWGVEGCLVPENRERALTQIRARAKGLQWQAKLRAALIAAVAEPAICAEVARTGDAAAPFYDEAVRRAEAKSKANATG